MTSWEYKVMKTDKHFWTGKDKTDPELFLSDFGRDGWELVSVVWAWHYLKRPIQ